MPFLLQVNDRRATAGLYTQMACAIAFCVYVFVYLYCYQGDVLAVGQHVLSGGQTHYVRIVGAVLITLALFVLQRGVFYLTKLTKRAHALTYFPSLLILTVITDVSPNIDKGFSFGGWLVAFPLLLIIYGVGVVWLGKIQPYEPEDNNPGPFSRSAWINLLTMAVMFLMVGLFSNHNDVFHYRVKMERLIQEGRYKKAIKVGMKSSSTDPALTMLRAHALAHEGLLGERFFQYPIPEGMRTLLPNKDEARTMLIPDSVVILFAKSDSARTDYKLTELLLQRNLGDFAEMVVKVYTDSLMPRHYAEALLLNSHLRGKAKPEKSEKSEDEENEMETLYEDFRRIQREYPPTQAANYLRRNYGNTYWYYYYRKRP